MLFIKNAVPLEPEGLSFVLLAKNSVFGQTKCIAPGFPSSSIIVSLLKSITNATIPKYKGLVWKVGSTGGNKIRAYMSLRKLVLGKLLLLFYYLLFIIIITFFKLTYISFYMYSNN